MNKFIAASAVIGLSTAATAHADLIAAWNFNYDAPNIADMLTVDHGAGTMTSGFALNSFSGSLVNAVTGDVSDDAFSPQVNVGGVSGGANQNGNSFTFTIDTSSVTSDLVLTYATRDTATGFQTQTIEWSNNGGSSWNPGAVFTDVDTTFSLRTVNFTDPGVYGQTSLMVRFTLTGGTAASGNNRYDNVQFNGAPTPGAATLLGLGLLGSNRRRRA
jgi:MYXO-CTERM domain-containing protein